MFVKQLILICVTLVSFYDAYAQLIHSLVTVHLDYCNSILYGLPDNSLYRLQKIQNTAARILARLPRFSHILATLFDLHWIPIKYRITFKICILTDHAYHRTAPSYLCDLIVPYVNVMSLRSNDKCLIKPIPRFPYSPINVIWRER